MPAPDSPERALLVEGPDDKHVVRHIYELVARTPPFCIIQKDGIEKLLPSIPPEFNVSGRKTLGILVDADDHPLDRWQSLRDRFSSLNVQLPNNPYAQGTIIQSQPRVGIWMMPDNMSPGELEDFIATIIPSDDPVWRLARGYIDNIPMKHRKFNPGKLRRAEVHAWLAARESPRRMGSAIGAGDMDINLPVSRSFTQWLKTLFS